MIDPRQGKRSASALEQLWLCPGAANAQAGLPEPEPDEAQVSGVRIHAALAGDIPSEKLTGDDHSTFTWMNEQASKLAEQYGFDPAVYRPERRLWMGDEFSGQPDRVYIKGVRALVLDFKAGFLPVTTASQNPQLATLGVLVIHNYSVARVTVAIVPRFGRVKEVAEYDIDTAEEALRFIRQIIADSEKPDAPRRPSDKACQYCRAKLRCPEYQAFASQALAVKESSLPALPAQQLALAIDRIPAANKLIAALKEEGKRRIAENDPEFTALYELGKGRNMRTIVNLVELFARVRALGVNDADFTRACSLEIGAFESLIETSTGLKGKALKQKCGELLAGLTDERQSKGSLQRKDETK